jgi:uncharacterized protein
MSVRRLLPWVVLLAACGGAPALPPSFSADDAATFQRHHELDVSGELGPLAAVASHYVASGQTLVLRVVDDQVVVATEGTGPAVRIEAIEAGARCLEGCGPAPLAIHGQEVVTLDRFSLLVSPQSGATRVLVHDPEAPARAGFAGLPWFAVDPRFIVAARWQPDPERPTVELSTSRGLTKPFVRAGVLSAEILGQPITLTGYQPAAGAGDRKAPLLVPLTDQTTGDRTYPVGRYLEVTLPESGPPVVDLNRATNPWCAYS